MGNEWLVVHLFPEMHCQSWHPLLRFSICMALNMKLVCFGSHVFYLQIVLCFCFFFFTIRLFTICFSDLPNKICVALKLPWIWGVTKMSCSGCLMGHFWQFPFKDIELQKGSWWKIFGFIFSLKWKTHFAERINRERYFGGATLKLQKYDTIKKRQICGVSCWW